MSKINIVDELRKQSDSFYVRTNHRHIELMKKAADIIETMDTKRTYAEGVEFGNHEILDLIESLLPDDFSPSKDWQNSALWGRIKWLKTVHTSMTAEIEELYTRINQQNTEIGSLQNTIKKLRFDKKRLDWLADTSQNLGEVLLPNDCVLNNIHSMRAAIDAAMKLDFNKRYLENIGEG